MRNAIVVIALLIILGAVNWSIYAKERQLHEGAVVYLELAPVDPRSLMQGDYMALRFKLAADIASAHQALESDSNGFVVVTLDERSVGQFARLSSSAESADGEIAMLYRIRGGTVKLATNAFFFQEGKAKQFEPARFGQFRVSETGELLLASMHDKKLLRLGDRPL